MLTTVIWNTARSRDTVKFVTLIAAIRAALLIAWLLSPAALVAVALLIWKRGRHSWSWKTGLFIAIAAIVISDWIVFTVLLAKAQTPYGAIFQTSYLTAILLSLSCFALAASFLSYPTRWPLSLSSGCLITLWVAIAYAPAHWLEKVDFGSVKVDDRPVPASVYIGYPTDSETEAVALVHVYGGADYFLSFGEEKVRFASKHEYLRLPGGIWSFRSTREMLFVQPLPFRQMNEFRVASPKGEVVSIQF